MPPAQLHQGDVKHGREKQPEEGHADHARKHGDAHGLAHFRAGTVRDDQREHAGNERDAGHQNGPQAEPAGRDGRIKGAEPLVLLALGEFDDENRVFAGQTHQHDQADLGEDVVVATLEPDARDGAQQAHGHDQNDGDGQPETFVERRQHEEHEEDAQRTHIHGRVPGQNPLIGQFGPFVIEPAGQGLLHDFRHQRLGLARAVTRGRPAVDFGRRIAVVTHHPVRSVGFRDLDERAQRHHFAPVIAGLEPGDVVGMRPEGRIGLGEHLVGAAKAVEIVHIERAEIDLHGLEQILQGHALGFGLDAVHLGVKLRDVDGEHGEHAAQPGGLVALADDALQILVEGVVAEIRAVLDV